MTVTYKDLAISQGATFHLAFENNLNSSTAQASTTSGTPVFSSTIKKYGAYSRHINASGTTAAAGYMASNFLTKFAASFWIYLANTPSTYQFLVMPITAMNDTFYYSHLVLGTDRKLEFYTRHYNSGTYDHFLFSVGAVPLNTWTHVAITYDQATGQKTIYLNGSQDTTITLPANQRATLQKFVKINHTGAAGTYLDGLSTWTNTTLPTASQIAAQASFIEAAPVATFTVSPSFGSLTDTFQFTFTGSGATSYAWTFGDGTSSTLQNPTKTYTTAGTYTVTLAATNEIGTTTQTYSLQVNGNTPISSFYADKTTAYLDVNQFAFTFTGAEYDSVLWNFGDGTTSTTLNPTKTYTAAGTYNVTVTATNAYGSTTSSSLAITVMAVPNPPTATFTLTPSSVQQYVDNVYFTFTGSGQTSVLWDFGDGTTSTDLNPIKAFSTMGTKSVKVTATNYGGSTVSATQTVTVTGIMPTSTFSVSDTSVKVGENVQLTYTGQYATAFLWTIVHQDGQTTLTSTEMNPTIQLPRSGNWSVTLATTNEYGTATSTSTTINAQNNFWTVEAGPLVPFRYVKFRIVTYGVKPGTESFRLAGARLWTSYSSKTTNLLANATTTVTLTDCTQTSVGTPSLTNGSMTNNSSYFQWSNAASPASTFYVDIVYDLGQTYIQEVWPEFYAATFDTEPGTSTWAQSIAYMYLSPDNITWWGGSTQGIWTDQEGWTTDGLSYGAVYYNKLIRYADAATQTWKVAEDVKVFNGTDWVRPEWYRWTNVEWAGPYPTHNHLF